MKCQLIVVFSPFHFFLFFPRHPFPSPFSVFSPRRFLKPLGVEKTNIFFGGFLTGNISGRELGNEIGTTE